MYYKKTEETVKTKPENWNKLLEKDTCHIISFLCQKRERQTHIGRGQATVLEVTIIIMIYGTNFRHQKGKNKNNQTTQRFYLGGPSSGLFRANKKNYCQNK